MDTSRDQDAFDLESIAVTCCDLTFRIADYPKNIFNYEFKQLLKNRRFYKLEIKRYRLTCSSATSDVGYS